MIEMFSGVINLRELDLSTFDTRKVNAWNDIWKGINNLTIIIDKEKNGEILTNISEGIKIIDINETGF